MLCLHVQTNIEGKYLNWYIFEWYTYLRTYTIYKEIRRFIRSHRQHNGGRQTLDIIINYIFSQKDRETGKANTHSHRQLNFQHRDIVLWKFIIKHFLISFNMLCCYFSIIYYAYTLIYIYRNYRMKAKDFPTSIHFVRKYKKNITQHNKKRKPTII